MFDLDNWQEIGAAIRKHKLRTSLTAFGVFWGILMLVLLLGAGAGLENGVLQMFSGMAKNTMYIWAETTSLPYQGFSRGRTVQFSNEDYHALAQAMPTVQFLAPNLFVGPTSITYQDRHADFTLKGTHPDLLALKPIQLLAGRFLNESDYQERKKHVVIGTRVQQILFGDQDPLGKYVSINEVFFKVVGVMSIEGTGADQRSYSESLYVPVSTLQQSFGYDQRIDDFILSPQPGIPAEQIESNVRLFLAQRHRIHPDDDKALGTLNTGKELEKFTSLFTGIRVFIWVVGIGTIIAGIVGVGNIMLIIVKERTKEIGIRKALGATSSSIISLIILESIVITSVSGYVGLVTGVGMVEGLRYLLTVYQIKSEFFTNPEINLEAALAALLILVTTGALAGLVPAMNAATIAPIEALRNE